MTAPNKAATRVKSLSEAHEETQKKTFTKWANVYLTKRRLGEAAGGGAAGRAAAAAGVGCCVPPSPASTTSSFSTSSDASSGSAATTIRDLETDLRDGKMLIKLVEALSNEDLPPPEKFDMRIHHLQNVGKALRFLNAKYALPLANIGAEDIVNGNLKLTLGLIWQLILIYQLQQVKAAERTKMAGRNSLPNSTSAMRSEQNADFSGSSSSAYPPTPPLSPGAKFRSCPALARPTASAGHGAERQLDGKSSLLSWCAAQLSDHVAAGRVPPVVDFGPSWRDGRAFLGLLNSYRAELVPHFEEYVSELSDEYQTLLPADVRKRWRYRLALAFTIAEKRMNIPRLLEPEDLLDVDIPDEKSVVTLISEWYIAMIQGTEPVEVYIDFHDIDLHGEMGHALPNFLSQRSPIADDETEILADPVSGIKAERRDDDNVERSAEYANVVATSDSLDAEPPDTACATRHYPSEPLSTASPSGQLPPVTRAAAPTAFEPRGTPEVATLEGISTDLLSAAHHVWPSPHNQETESRIGSSKAVAAGQTQEDAIVTAAGSLFVPTPGEVGGTAAASKASGGDSHVDDDARFASSTSSDAWIRNESKTPPGSGSTVYESAHSTPPSLLSSSSSWQESPSPPSSSASSSPEYLLAPAPSSSLESPDGGPGTLPQVTSSALVATTQEIPDGSVFDKFRDPFRAAFASARQPRLSGMLSDVTTAAISVVLLPMLTSFYLVVGSLRIDVAQSVVPLLGGGETDDEGEIPPVEEAEQEGS